MDSILDKGIITVGNQNDYINCLQKCWPNATSEQANEFSEKLDTFESGTVLTYILSDESDDSSVLSIPVTENLFILFFLNE